MDENKLSSISKAASLEKMESTGTLTTLQTLTTQMRLMLSLQSHVLCQLSWNCCHPWRSKRVGVV